MSMHDVKHWPQDGGPDFLIRDDERRARVIRAAEKGSQVAINMLACHAVAIQAMIDLRVVLQLYQVGEGRKP